MPQAWCGRPDKPRRLDPQEGQESDDANRQDQTPHFPSKPSEILSERLGYFLGQRDPISFNETSNLSSLFGKGCGCACWILVDGHLEVRLASVAGLRLDRTRAGLTGEARGSIATGNQKGDAGLAIAGAGATMARSDWITQARSCRVAQHRLASIHALFERDAGGDLRPGVGELLLCHVCECSGDGGARLDPSVIRHPTRERRRWGQSP